MHFHVPVFLDDLGAFRTTRFAIAEALAVHKALPAVAASSRSRPTRGTCCRTNLKTGDIVDYVCREIEWVRDQLLA